MQDYSGRILELETHQEALRVELEALAGSFLQEANRVISEWFLEEARTTVVGNPHRAKVLGREGIAKLKSDVAELQGQIANLLEQHVNNERVWLHRTNLAVTLQRVEPYEVERRLRAPIAKALDPLFTELGKLLERYELIHFGEESPWEKKYGVGSPPTRRFGHPSSDALSLIEKRYVERASSLFDVQCDLDRTVRAKEEAEASDLWEDA